MENSLAQSIDLGQIPTDVAFHPSVEHPLLACGTLDGWVGLYGDAENSEYNSGKWARRARVDIHQGPCRAVEFVKVGLCTCGSNERNIVIIDLETQKECVSISEAHDQELNRLLSLDENVFASGDEGGVVKFWDVREGNHSPVAEAEPHSDYVSDMVMHGPEKALLSSSGDGTLSMIDLNKFKVRHTTEEDADDELLSVALVRCGKKVVCGTTSGVLNIYSWGYWNDCSDRFPGHPDSVTSMVAFDEETILTGSSDGLIRVLNIQPNKMLGVLGEHSDFDIERIVLCPDKSCLASISHDNKIKLWNAGLLLEDDSASETAEEHDGDDTIDREDDESSDEDPNERNKRKKKKGKGKGEHKIPKKNQSKRPDNSNNFFSDLL
eukprot:jgi/Picsp_1/1897/NSC_05363-R1_protein